MNPLITVGLLRTLFVVVSGLMGVVVGSSTVLVQSSIRGLLFGLLFGLVMVLFDLLLKGITLRLFSSATFGLLLGFAAAQLLLASDALHYLDLIDHEVVWIISLVLYCGVGYLGMMLAIRSNRDEFSLIIPYVRFRQTDVLDSPVILDTNMVIAGRIAEICATGFVSSSLIIPRFVVEDLQKLAESTDVIQRDRGHQGLEHLSNLQRNARLNVTIHQGEWDADMPEDARLIQLAKLLNARLLTNDASLSKSARILNVQALNLNELAATLRCTLETGDQIELLLTKEGRDSHQAVGYLPDGTMIVVNHARSLIRQQVRVVITGNIQTSAGRMFFADLQDTLARTPAKA